MSINSAILSFLNLKNMGKIEQPESHERKDKFPFYKITAALAAVWALGGPLKDLTQADKKVSSPDRDKIEALNSPPGTPIPMKAETGDIAKQRNYSQSELRTTFFKEDASGNPEFNFWSLIAMLQAEIPYIDTESGEVNIKIPYEYARLFDRDPKSKEPVHQEDHEKLGKFIEDEFNKLFAEILYGYDWSKNVKNLKQPEVPTELKIEGIEITGTASPEGPQDNGPETIKQGKIDQENLGLALKRGQVGLSLTEEWLKKSGVNLKQLEEAARNIQAREIQFSDDEMKLLADLSKKWKGSDDASRIHRLIIDYNRGQVKDANIVSQLDQIIGSKRMVEITIKYEKNEKRRVLIPIPILPILIGVSLPFLARKRELREEISGIPEEVKTIDAPGRETEEGKEMEIQTVVDDLGMFFDREEAVRRGIDYRAMAEDVQSKGRHFKDPAEKEIYLANNIIKSWKEHDAMCRKEAGWSPGHINQGLDYENQPRQIQWAKVHARVLLEMADENKKTGEDYKSVLERRIAKVQNRRK
jgi:hypothetical protein